MPVAHWSISLPSFKFHISTIFHPVIMRTNIQDVLLSMWLVVSSEEIWGKGESLMTKASGMLWGQTGCVSNCDKSQHVGQLFSPDCSVIHPPAVPLSLFLLDNVCASEYFEFCILHVSIWVFFFGSLHVFPTKVNHFLEGKNKV